MLITIDRQWSDTIGIDDDGTPGWICWIKVWKDGADFEVDEPVDDMIANRKKDAYTWSRQKYPGARISYVTDCHRKAR